MAAILRAPSGGSKGVVSFTTQERDHLINVSSELKEKVRALKSRWVVGLHHNWHDFKFQYDPVFDFSLAGEGDLIETRGRPFNLIPMDACNFVPAEFAPRNGEKFWDVLFVARAVIFKNIPEFFQAIRTLYDAGHKLRVLFICPIPPIGADRSGNTLYDIREVYEGMFVGEERQLFTLLTLNFGYPFPFDLPTLAHFYGASRVFVHSAANERRCRVAAYAWANGMPVVAMENVGSLLPGNLRRPPLFFEAKSYSEFPARILEAIAATPGAEAVASVREHFSEALTAPHFRRRLEEMAGPAPETRYSLTDLAFRLGRHHELGTGTNRVQQHFKDLVDSLSSLSDGEGQLIVAHADPEMSMASNAIWIAREVVVPKENRPWLLRRILSGGARRLSSLVRRSSKIKTDAR